MFMLANGAWHLLGTQKKGMVRKITLNLPKVEKFGKSEAHKRLKSIFPYSQELVE
jgi:hypothetical protein